MTRREFELEAVIAFIANQKKFARESAQALADEMFGPVAEQRTYHDNGVVRSKKVNGFIEFYNEHGDVYAFQKGAFVKRKNYDLCSWFYYREGLDTNTTISEEEFNEATQ